MSSIPLFRAIGHLRALRRPWDRIFIPRNKDHFNLFMSAIRRAFERIRKRIKARAPPGQDVDVDDLNTIPTPLPHYDPVHRFQDFVGAVVQQRRRSIPVIPGPPDAPVSARRISNVPDLTPVATTPLPTELFYLIIDNYLSSDIVSLLHLSRAIPQLQHQCWTHAFAMVPISVREREGRKQKVTSNVDLFLQLITHVPRILLYVQGLDIKDKGRNIWRNPLGTTSENDFTTLALVLVQSQRMPILKTFRIRCPIHWSTLPSQLRASFWTLFQSASLEDVVLAELAFPINLLAKIPNLRSVDIQTGGASVPVLHPSVPLAPHKRIQLLKVRDRNVFGQAAGILGFSEARTRPFSLSHLKHLEICLPGNRLSTIQPGITLCTSLESFKIFVGTAGGLPQSLSLNSLPLLKALTLSTDVTSNLEIEYRFHWLIDTLSTLPEVPTTPTNKTPNRNADHEIEPAGTIEAITVLIRIDSLLRGRQCDWSIFDNAFSGGEGSQSHESKSISTKWSSLRALNIVWCTGRREDLREDLNQEFINDLPTLMPHLAERGIVNVQTTYSDAFYNFWTFS